MDATARRELRGKAMAALSHAPTPWSAIGACFSAAGDEFSRGSCNLERGLDGAFDLAAYIAAAHPGVVIELLDKIDCLKKEGAAAREALLRQAAEFGRERDEMMADMRENETRHE